MWLKKLRERSLYYSGKEIPTALSISCVQIPKKVEYSLFPEDYIEKGGDYTCPQGYLTCLPETAVYFVVKPPIVIEDGKRITNLNWHRKLISSNGIFDSYSIKDVEEENPFKTLQGDLFGTLNSGDLIDKIGKWEDCFPLTHYLEISYPVALRDLGQMNPLTIRIQPAETFKN